MSALKAYKVEDYEGFGEVVFAETSGKAKTHLFYIEDADFTGLSVRRAPEFDQYIGQTITPEIYLKHGWWWTCATCERYVDADDGVVINGEVYCRSHFEDEETKGATGDE